MSDASDVVAAESGGANRLDPLGTFGRLRDAYFRYYDTPFGLADPLLQGERRALLDRDGGAWRPPLLELRPEYRTTGRTLAESAAAAGATGALAQFAACGLLPDGRRLYRHQEEALRAALEPGANMAITAGTGSGKTESFVLPVLAGLLAESEGWGGAPAQPDRWWAGGGHFRAQRDGETGHPAAVRALVLYPMNALVDDQLTRMRRALDSDAARRWLDTHRAGHRFFFGRYTGSTPVTGAPTNGLAVRNLRQYLIETERRQARARELAGTVEGAEFFVPRLDGAEMRSRWDMQAAPPDILITNYSMLNVMLHRGREVAFFELTRQWLESDPAHRFTLVVDELHMYRGTAGTEVAYLLRALFHRLGLRERPEQLRVLAASASLDPDRDAGYLEQFFGIDRSTFRFVAGTLVEPSPTGAGVAAADLAQAPPVEAAALARGAGTVTELRRAFAAPGQPPTAVTAEQLATRLFPGADPHTAGAATANLLAGLAAAPEAGDPKLRAHMFFRNIPGMWACSDPDCGELADGERSPGTDGRRVGRLHAEPVTRCGCGARVLELLYCQTCGDVFLGGFATRDAAQKQQFRSILLPSVPDLARLPDQVRVDRNASNYIVYWPRPHSQLTELNQTSWTADRSTRKFEFRPSLLSPFTGELANTRSGFTGWSFHAGSSRDRNTGAYHHPLETLSPFPTLCPNCGDDWEIRFTRKGAVPFGDPLRERSPIRGMRTGFEKINQVLTTALACDLPMKDRKAIVFTDSRQDAAKLSSGLALRHYQDLLRLLVYRQLQDNHDPADDIASARLHYTDKASRTPATRAAAERLRRFDAAALDELRDLWDDEDPAAAIREEILARRYGRGTTLSALCAAVGAHLLSIGVNPAGPAASLQHTEDKVPAAWTTLYDWEASPVQPKPAGRLGPTQQSLLAEIDERLREECIDALFSGAGRDFESLGLGWIALTGDTGDPAEGANTPAGRVRAALRVLADLRRFTSNRDPRTDAPPKLRKLWEEIDRRGGPAVAESGQELDGVYAAPAFLVDPDAVVIRPAGSQAWVCDKCRRTHLTVGCGLCTRCRRPLPSPVELVKADTDYYSWRAITRTGEFRLNCAELTGQTDRLDAQSRQSRFQNVFLGSPQEHPLPDGLDLLSVTTTMEAGVDIGALSVVVLGNMPPTRFNYQQRVGRAGRRDTPVAVALTVCRGRSHDEYYFDHPEAITSEPTPKPYLALDQDEIIRRALASAVLDAAFAEIGPALAVAGFELTANVHGAFGLVTDWPTNTRALLAAWLGCHASTVRELAAAIAIRTPHESTSTELGVALAGSLVASIDAAAGAAGSADLSQRLAERGILPMYGFPTSVRYLHLRKPGAAYPWPPAGVIDRDLPMAVAQFAPLSEVVRDGSVYQAVGVAAFEPVRGRAAPVADPLGPSRRIGNCRNCSHVDPGGAGTAAACPRCGADDGQYQQFELREPLGFRASRGRDFDGTFAFHPRALSTRAATDFEALTEHHTSCYTVHSGPGDRYVINDNRGELFEFRPASEASWGGYVSAEAIRGNALNASAGGTGDAKQVAIGAVQPTDLMFFGPTAPVLPSAGIRLNITGRTLQPDGAEDPADGRRAAWYSLAFLLRRAAAEKLDVNTLELAAGIYAGLADDQPATFAFLADTAENGAGFSTQLGLQSEFPALLARVQELLTELGEPEHAGHCTSSCYRCLQDYSNMAYHSMLDWRLARDLLAVLTTQQLPMDSAWEQRSAQQWARGLAGEAEVIESLPAAAVRFHYRSDSALLVVRHTLEAAERGFAAPRLLEAREAAASLGACRVVFVDPFTLDRDPKRPLEMVEAGV